MDIAELHTPVMLDRCIELLGPALSGPAPVVVDATLGMGGHTEALLRRFPALSVIGLDRDPHALELAGRRLAGFGTRLRRVHTVYDGIADALVRLGTPEVDGVLFDLGVSSLQLDEAERGFSYAHDVPLDMRMDPTASLTAEQILADYSEEDLRRIFRDWGEERLAGRFAKRIVAARAQEPITHSAQLVELIARATPAAVARSGHPAKRVFQALRIEVNGELDALQRALPRALDALRLGGRIVVLAYHSLEDRIVKREFAARAQSSTPQGLPVELPDHQPQLRMLVRGAELASEAEKADNPRAASVRLRAAEKIRALTGPSRTGGIR